MRKQRAGKPVVTVVIETGTREFTDAISVERSVRGHLEEVRRFSPDGSKAEVLYVGENLPTAELMDRNCRCLSRPRVGYYGWKNAGARAARGRYVVFWDSDCRPEKGYLGQAVKVLDKNPGLWGLGGVSRYDGGHFFARLNTVLSFGYLYQGKGFGRSVALSHNLVIRRSKFPADPFGPYYFRVGGDMYLTQAAEQAGHPIKLDPKLLIHHEDPSFSPTALLERHLRGLFEPLLWYPLRSRFLAILYAFRAIAGNLRRWTKKLFVEGRALNFSSWEAVLGLPVLAFYTILDSVAVLVLAVIPGLLTRLLEYHLGPRYRNGWDVRGKIDSR